MLLKKQCRLDQTDLWLKGCLNGDRQSQFNLYNAYAPVMMGVCMRYAHNKAEASEILQDGFIKVFEKLEQFRGEGSLEGWMRRIMVTTALQKFRSMPKKKEMVPIETVMEFDTSESDAIDQLSAKELMELVQQLPPAYRMVFNLYVFEGMKHKEIATALNISEGTSKSNLSDARKILQNAVKIYQKGTLPKAACL